MPGKNLSAAQKAHLRARRTSGPNLLDIAEKVRRERGNLPATVDSLKRKGSKMWDTLLSRGAAKAETKTAAPAKPAQRLKSRAEVDAIVLNAENAVRRARENRRKRGRPLP